MMLRMGGRGGGGVPGGDAYMNYGYIDWQFSPAAYLRFGRQNTVFAAMSPLQMLGTSSGHVVAIGFGNFNHTSTRDGARLSIKFSDMMGLDVMAIDPDNDNAEDPVGYGTTATGVNREENSIPRLDVALPIKLGSLTIVPSLTYLTQEYDEVAAGNDNSVDILGYALSIKLALGTFSFTGEVVAGDNLANGNYSGGIGGAETYTDASGNSKVSDSENLAWFGMVSIKLGPSSLNLMYGSNSYENDNDGGTVAAPLKTEVERTFYGISWPIGVAKGLTIRPEYMVYDYDESATVQGVTGINNGKESIAGVQFMLAF